jgi:hypothetical protein
MPDTREASQRNLTKLFHQSVQEYQGALKLEPSFPQWEERPDANTLTPGLYFYCLGSPTPHYIRFSKAVFDDCAHEHKTAALAQAKDIIRRKLDALINTGHP